MAKAELIEFTGKGRVDEQRHAANILVFTKQTRLEMSGQQFKRVQDMSEAELQSELDYMAGTIPSSWEMIDVTFLMSGVSRAAAQQITRTRTASFAMQSLRVVDASDLGVVNPFGIDNYLHDEWDSLTNVAKTQYKGLIAAGAQPQEARAILPLNTECSLVAKYNLRSFVELVQKRSSLRVQGEYSDLVDQMKAEVLEVWPWAAAFFVNKQQRALDMLEEVVEELGLTPGKGSGWKIAKAMDLIRENG